MASCSKVIARSDSSRSHAAEPIRHRAGSSRGERLIWRRYRTSSLLLPNGSVQARIQSLCGPASARGPWPADGGLLIFQESENAAYGLAAGGRA